MLEKDNIENDFLNRIKDYESTIRLIESYYNCGNQHIDDFIEALRALKSACEDINNLLDSRENKKIRLKKRIYEIFELVIKTSSEYQDIYEWVKYLESAEKDRTKPI